MNHRIEDPTIIVGTFRSASTLVAELLGSHQDCHYLWFELSEEISRATGVPFGAPGSDDLPCPPLSSDDADDRQARALRQLVRDRCERDGVEPGARLVIKNPHLWHRLGWVRALLPEARLVVTVRDLHPTVASLKVLWQRSLRQHAHMHHLPEDPEPIEPERQGEWRDRLEPAEHRALERFVDRHREELRALDARLDGPLVGSVMDGAGSTGRLDPA